MTTLRRFIEANKSALKTSWTKLTTAVIACVAAPIVLDDDDLEVEPGAPQGPEVVAANGPQPLQPAAVVNATEDAGNGGAAVDDPRYLELSQAMAADGGDTTISDDAGEDAAEGHTVGLPTISEYQSADDVTPQASQCASPCRDVNDAKLIKWLKAELATAEAAVATRDRQIADINMAAAGHIAKIFLLLAAMTHRAQQLSAEKEGVQIALDYFLEKKAAADQAAVDLVAAERADVMA